MPRLHHASMERGTIPMAELLITLADGRTRRVTCGPLPQVIGRDARCDIPIDDLSASRQHARISLGPIGYIVEDMGSKNGTLVNDAPCTGQPLRDGDRVLIGSTAITFRDGPKESTTGVIISDDETVTPATRYATRDRDLHLSQQRLKMIYELSERLTTLQGLTPLLNNAMDICFEMLHFERGAIGVRRPSGRLLDWPVVRNLRNSGGELTISRTLLRRALENGERAIFTPEDAAALDPTVSMIQQGIRSAMCVPLIHDDMTLGVIYGDRIQSAMGYAQEDIDFLAGIARQVSIGLINSRLADEQKRLERLSRDLELARKIQNGLLPTDLPDHDGLRVAALNEPGQLVSGDYYDVIETPDGRVWCLVADVTGEGVAAAMLMASLQAAVRVTIRESDDPAELLARWNRFLHRNTDRSRFITCLLMLLDPQRRTMRCASAGHFPPMIIRPEAKEIEEQEMETGYPLGIMEAETYPAYDIPLGDGPVSLLAYTDGVVEARDTEENMFGHASLVRAVQERTQLPPQALIKHVRKEVSHFVGAAAQSDDLTLLAARLG
ncbi:MAG: SpoIIE family protein phosphatase [Phycisphaerae bacterium]|nr:SpoIIE family protein phosphatase [Phycisphaerae bacterium]